MRNFLIVLTTLLFMLTLTSAHAAVNKPTKNKTAVNKAAMVAKSATNKHQALKKSKNNQLSLKASSRHGKITAVVKSKINDSKKAKLASKDKKLKANPVILAKSKAKYFKNKSLKNLGKTKSLVTQKKNRKNMPVVASVKNKKRLTQSSRKSFLAMNRQRVFKRAAVVADIDMPSRAIQVSLRSQSQSQLPLRQMEQTNQIPAVEAKIMLADLDKNPKIPKQTQSMLKQGMSMLGTPYRFGGSSRVTGFDCSGFVGYLYREKFGIQLPRSTREMIGIHAPSISKRDLKPGDIIFFNSRGRGNVNHAGIYIGNNKFIHSSSKRSGGVRVDSLNDSYWRTSFMMAKRALALASRINASTGSSIPRYNSMY